MLERLRFAAAATAASPFAAVQPPDPEGDVAGELELLLEPPLDEPPLEEPPLDEPPLEEPPLDELVGLCRNSQATPFPLVSKAFR